MAKILKNNTGSDVFISDVGQTVPASGQLTISPSDYDKYAESDDVIIYIADITLTVNDGSFDLSISDGVDLIKSNFSRKVSLLDNEDKDAFGRFRVSNPKSIFDVSFTVDKQPLIFTESTATGGTATYNTNKKSVDLATTTSSGSSVVFQSKRYFKYHPGKSQLVQMSGNFGGNKTNCRRRFGLFDSDNGLYFELDGSTLNVVVRSSVSGSIVNTSITQSSFNLDPLDGSGKSGVTFDSTKQQIFLIDFQWLGSGRIRFGFNFNGRIVYCHEVLNANILTVPYMQKGTLPIRVENTNTGVSASTTTSHITCATIISEGDYAPEGLVRAISNEGTSKTVSGSSLIPVISIRKKSSELTNPIKFVDYSFFANTIDDFEIRIILNATLTGSSFSDVDGIAQRDVSATTLSGGQVIYSTYVRGASGGTSSTPVLEKLEAENFILGNDLSGNSDTLTIAARSLTGTSNCFASIVYRELI